MPRPSRTTERSRGARALATLLGAGLLLAGGLATAQSPGEPGRFDYYVAVLSWSPTYCETEGRGRDEPQCAVGRPYAFVLHGLWPQYARGWPENCPVDGRAWVPEATIRAMLDIMPARGLVIHQYRKHGTCAGLPPGDYFAAARRAFEAIAIPDRYRAPTAPIAVAPSELVADFLAANPGLTRDMLAVVCGHGDRLREVRVCLSRDLAPRACGVNENPRRLCRLDRVVLPPVRGGG